MVDRSGQFLGNYRLVRLLGRGGFAQVYLGEHVRLETQTAIKLLSTHLAADDVEQFLQEARTVARLEHPHIIRILDFDFDREEDIPFLVMSYAPNGTLRQRYPKGTRLPPERILAYLKQAASALQYAHDARMIHRDIKPENMLLGRQDEVLLSDFGIAVVAHSSRSQNTQETIGTVAYMAPEQIQGKPRPASDQYALAVTIYEWLCGCTPFQGTTAEISVQHLHADPPPLREQVPGIPPAVEAVILKALEKDPHRRFSSVQEFATAFEQACQNFLPEAITPSPRPTSWLETVSQVAGPAAFYASPTLAEKALSPTLPEKRRVSRRLILLGGIGLVGTAAISGGMVWAFTQRLSPGSTLVIYTGHQGPVTSVAWSPDGARVASGSQDQTVHAWDASNGTRPLIYRGHTTNINTIAWSPARIEPLIASAGGNDFFKGGDAVQIWNAATATYILSYPGDAQPVRSVAWSPDGTRIASGGEGKVVQVWNASNQSLIQSYTGHQAAVNAVAWSPDGTHIASASDDKTAQIWDVQSATLLVSLAHTSTVNAVAWSPDGMHIATASGSLFWGGEHSVRVWDAATGAQLLTYQGHIAPVSTVAWSPDGQRIASASASLDKTVHIWNATNGAALFTYRDHTLGVTAAAWSPDGTYIASAGNDGTVRVWRAT